MPIFVSCDKGLFNTCWRQTKYRAIAEEAAKKRIKCCFVFSRAELLTHEAEYLAEPSTIVLIPGTLSEIDSLLAEYSGLPLHTVLFAHHARDTFTTDFSYIMSDQPSAMKTAVAHLREKGCKRLALFGVTPGSNHDYSRMENFLRYGGERDPLIFTIEKGEHFADCLQKLLRCEETIDALLCVNDFLALSLMPVLAAIDPEWNRKLLLLGFSDIRIGQLYSPSLTSLSLGYAEGGRQIVRLHRAVVRDPDIAYMHILMRSKLCARDTTAAENPRGIRFANLPALSEAETGALLARRKPLMAIENLLNRADETDLALILGLLRGKSQSLLAKELFLAPDSIKYRVRKLKNCFGLSTTAEVTDLLCYWLDADKTEKWLSERA